MSLAPGKDMAQRHQVKYPCTVTPLREESKSENGLLTQFHPVVTAPWRPQVVKNILQAELASPGDSKERHLGGGTAVLYLVV